MIFHMAIVTRLSARFTTPDNRVARRSADRTTRRRKIYDSVVSWQRHHVARSHRLDLIDDVDDATRRSIAGLTFSARCRNMCGLCSPRRHWVGCP